MCTQGALHAHLCVHANAGWEKANLAVIALPLVPSIVYVCASMFLCINLCRQSSLSFPSHFDLGPQVLHPSWPSPLSKRDSNSFWEDVPDLTILLSSTLPDYLSSQMPYLLNESSSEWILFLRALLICCSTCSMTFKH